MELSCDQVEAGVESSLGGPHTERAHDRPLLGGCDLFGVAGVLLQTLAPFVEACQALKQKTDILNYMYLLQKPTTQLDVWTAIYMYLVRSSSGGSRPVSAMQVRAVVRATSAWLRYVAPSAEDSTVQNR